MPSARKKRRYLYFITVFLTVCYVLPNIFNFREAHYFSDDDRLKEAKESSAKLSDSINIIPGEYYKSSSLYVYLFGAKNRDLWTTPVTAPVLYFDTTNGGLTPYEIGGSQQTIAIRLKDKNGKNWVLRSVNKDQRTVLKWWLRASILRPLIRDQVSSMNPYAAKIVSQLANAIGLPHNDPKMYWVPFDARYGSYNERIAGRLVYLEENIDSTWREKFDALNIVDTEDMLQLATGGDVAIDTMQYLETRLFDMLINDWDRHERQWRWLLTIDPNGKKIFKPIAKDRDMAFYIFDEGLINRMITTMDPKFQSFRKDFKKIEGLMEQAAPLDKKILKGVPREYFISMARKLRSQLNRTAIDRAFMEYPPVIYNKVGKEHEAILTSRLSQLDTAAAKFYDVLNKD